MSLGSFLKSERKCRNLTQEDVAAEVGVVSPVVSKWENDKGVPDLAALSVLCNMLELDIDEIAAQKRFDDGKKRIVPPKVYDARKTGETLRLLRIKNGLSQSEVGQKLYVTPQTVSKWEGGAVTLLETLVKLAEFYGVSPSAVVCGLADDESATQFADSVAEGSQKRTAKTYKRGFIIVTAVLAVMLIANAIGGIYLGTYINKLRSAASNVGGATANNPALPNKDVCKLTIHTPDGKEEVYELKFGEPTAIEPKYQFADVKFLRYNDKPDGTGKSYGGAAETWQIFSDLDVYPTYPFAKWVNFLAATSAAERESCAAVESKMQELEQSVSRWFNGWYINMFGEMDYRSWHEGVEYLKLDSPLASGYGARGEYTIYESSIPDAVTEIYVLIGDSPIFADLKDSLAAFVKTQSQLNYEFQDYEYVITDYNYKTEEEKRACDKKAHNEILNKFLARTERMAKEFYANLNLPDNGALWNTDILRDFKNIIWDKAAELAEQYNLPSVS